MISGIVERLLKIVGWLAVLLALLLFIVCLSEGIDGAGIAIVLFFLILGIALVVLGNKMKKSARVKQYIDLVMNQEITAIADIAVAFPSTYGKVRTELQEMINEGYFPNAYLDDASGTIILSQNNQYRQTDDSVTERSNSEPGQMKCESCGAIVSAVAVKKGECEYCGAAIKY